MAFLFKAFTLTIRTAAKPLANRFERYVVTHPTLRPRVIKLAQVRSRSALYYTYRLLQQPRRENMPVAALLENATESAWGFPSFGILAGRDGVSCNTALSQLVFCSLQLSFCP